MFSVLRARSDLEKNCSKLKFAKIFTYQILYFSCSRFFAYETLQSLKSMKLPNPSSTRLLAQTEWKFAKGKTIYMSAVTSCHVRNNGHLASDWQGIKTTDTARFRFSSDILLCSLYWFENNFKVFILIPSLDIWNILWQDGPAKNCKKHEI